MTVNPYAPPQSSFQEPPRGGGGPSQPWTINEVLSAGWEITKRQWPVLVFAPLVASLVGNGPMQLAQRMVDKSDLGMFIGVTIAMALWSWLAGAFFEAGMIKLFLSAARGGSADFGDLFGGGGALPQVMAAQLLMILAILGGTLLLIVPGILLALGLSMTGYYVVDAGLGPVEAMKASWEAMKGQKGQLFLFGIASVGVLLVGMLACCVGVFVSIAIIRMAIALIFLRVSGRVEP